MINMNKIKLKEDHYVVVDDSKIKEGDWLLDTTDNTIWGCYKDMSIYLFPECKKITHSTRPFGGSATAISLHEVKELIGEVDVEKKAEDAGFYDSTEDNKGNRTTKAFLSGYNQAFEDNKEKKYTDEDIRKAILMARVRIENVSPKYSIDEIFKSLQPKTSWEVEIVDGKLKLK